MGRSPVDAPFDITTEFGVPDSNAQFGKHSGIDYYLYEEPIGSPIYAPASGQLWNIPSKTGGNMVVVFDGTWFHRLMHNSSFSRGDGYVDEGNEVARSGYTGLVVPKDARGAHCHWDINNQGVYPDSFAAFIDPNVWLNNQGDDEMSQATVEDIYKNINETNQRQDTDEKNLSDLYTIVDNLNKTITDLVKPGGRLDTDYANIMKVIEESK